MKEQRPGNRGWLILLILFMIIWHKPILKVFFVLKHQEKILKYSRTNQLNPALISAMIFVESGFDSGARSHKGAIGLMQIMPNTGHWVAKQIMLRGYSSQDLLDPEKNLEVGTWYLAYLRRYFNQNNYLALASYNAGHRYVSEWLNKGIWDGNSVKIEQIPFPETKKYLLKIIVFEKIYHYLYPELVSRQEDNKIIALK